MRIESSLMPHNMHEPREYTGKGNVRTIRDAKGVLTDMIPKNKQEAQGLAEQHLPKMRISPPTEVAILGEHTIETDFGWVFFWNSKEYVETDEFRYALAGNAPLIVDRRDGSIHETSTAEPIEEIIERYRRTHALAS